jgi:hypothetical protein
MKSLSLKKVKEAISKISFEKSCVDMGWEWEIKKVEDGFHIRTTFQRPDVNTGVVGKGFGRWMFIHKNCGEDSVIKTAWLCCELIVKHELMESFLVSGKRIFDPHKTIEELSYFKKK